MFCDIIELEYLRLSLFLFLFSLSLPLSPLESIYAGDDRIIDFSKISADER